jgi:hypothetical protein
LSAQGIFFPRQYTLVLRSVRKIPWANKLLRDLTRESVTDAG